MIEIEIPGFRHLRLEHLVLDYNGTLAVDGSLLPDVGARLRELSTRLQIHVVTADTFGLARSALEGLPMDITILPPESQCKAKRMFVLKTGAESVVAIGNGHNDHEMLATAGVGIAVIQREGASAASLSSANIVVTGIADALDLLLQPRRIIATLRR